MKIVVRPFRPGRDRVPPRSERGVAMVVVLVLLGILSMLMVSDARSLARMKAEMLRIEAQQLEKYGEPGRGLEPDGGSSGGAGAEGGR